MWSCKNFSKKWHLVPDLIFFFFCIRLQLGQFATNTSCETFPFVPFESCFHMIIIYQTYQDKVNQCGESGLSVLLTQSWLDITRRFNLFVFIDQDMFMYQSTKKLDQIGKTIVRALKIPLRITGFIVSKVPFIMILTHSRDLLEHLTSLCQQSIHETQSQMMPCMFG